jgi:hypothetical protein
MRIASLEFVVIFLNLSTSQLYQGLLCSLSNLMSEGEWMCILHHVSFVFCDGLKDLLGCTVC